MGMTLQAIGQFKVGSGSPEPVIFIYKTKNVEAAMFSSNMAMIRFVFVVALA